MRLFLDAHISPRAVATALRGDGHDVRAADEERALDGWTDEDLLALATTEQRVFVTFNVRDFPRIAREWLEAGRNHAGCIVFVRMDHSEFGEIIAGLRQIFEDRSEQEQWSDVLHFASRRSKG